jgi:hypothetical protein
MSARGKARAKAGVIARMERKIQNLEVKCGSLAAENRKLKKELEKYKEPERCYDPRVIIDGAKRVFSKAPYIQELWLKGLGEEMEDEHTGDVQQPE